VSAPHEHQPLLRFSNRVEDYIRHRPGYPPELIGWLRDVIDLRPSWIVADVGSGTGLLAGEFCRHGNLVYGVEPNAAMRAAAEELMAREPHFVSVDGSAEATTLPDGSVDLVAAGQAFHWFEPEAARTEWKRILSPGGRALIVFNSRRIETTPFMRAYDALLVSHAVDYQGVDHRRVLGDGLRAFLDDIHEWRFEFSRVMTFEDVRGLSMSSSYVPAPDHPTHAAFMEALKKLVDEHAKDGTVEMLYETEAYVGRL
jgi:SAM-dependent methyltransferase